MGYTATAVREGRFWVVDVHGVGRTQGRTAAEAREMALDLIAVMADEDAQDVDLALEFTVGDIEATEVAEVRVAVADAALAQERAATRSRNLAARLRAAGLTGRDIAEILGVSPQRVSQLMSK